MLPAAFLILKYFLKGDFQSVGRIQTEFVLFLVSFSIFGFHNTVFLWRDSKMHLFINLYYFLIITH